MFRSAHILDAMAVAFAFAGNAANAAVAPETWRLSKVKSASNCLACHARANQGVFYEHEIRIPY